MTAKKSTILKKTVQLLFLLADMSHTFKKLKETNLIN